MDIFFHFSLVNTQEREDWVRCQVYILYFQKLSKRFTKYLHHFTFPPGGHEGSYSSISSPTLRIAVQFLPFSQVGISILVVVQSLSCPTLWDPMDCNPPSSSVHGISQARTLEWVPICFSRGHLPNPDKPCLLHWKSDSLPLSHQGSPIDILLSFNRMVKNVEHYFMHLSIFSCIYLPSITSLLKCLFKYFVHFNWDAFLIIEF